MNDKTFEQLHNCGAAIQVAVTRPSRILGLAASVVLGTVAYLVDKKIYHSIHPRLPRFLGLRQEFVDVTLCRSAGDVHRVLMAAAAPPPIMRAVQLDGAFAFDGGYTDNAPIPTQTQSERLGTMVMLTRHYPARPSLFRFGDRLYWQPSRAVPVSTWDCTKRSTVDQAFELGYADAKAMVRIVL